MTTTLLNAEIELSKILGDYYSSSTTSAGDSNKTTIVDTSLQEKPEDWINEPEAYDMITSGSADEEERKILYLDMEDGVLTVRPHGAQIAVGVTYRVHRLFTASEKRIALVWAARNIFPHCFVEIRDETKVLGNWARNGSFEEWTISTVPDYWVKDSVTAAKNTTAPYVFHGSSSLKLTTSAGNIKTTNTQVPDFSELAGHSITIKLKKAWCDTASCLRISIYDGMTTTTSDWHDGDSALAKDGLECTATIADEPTEITFKVLHDVGAGVSYADDFRIIGPRRGRIYIGDLNLAQDRPHFVSRERSDYSQAEPWIPIRGTSISKDDYLHIPTSLQDYRMRILGIGYLGFILSGASSTSWAATIAIDSPQIDILTTKAATYLCKQRIMPTYTTGENDRWREALAYWERELNEKIAKFAMKQPPALRSWILERNVW